MDASAIAVRPESLFADFTYLTDERVVQAIRARCREAGKIAFIEWHPVEEIWVFHTLDHCDGKVSRKDCAEWFKRPQFLDERTLQTHIVGELRLRGELGVREFVACGAGVADIVTERAIYEVKLSLTRGAIFHAAGQALMYRAAINSRLKAVIVGPRCPGDEHLATWANAIGVDVWFFEVPHGAR